MVILPDLHGLHSQPWLTAMATEAGEYCFAHLRIVGSPHLPVKGRRRPVNARVGLVRYRLRRLRRSDNSLRIRAAAKYCGISAHNVPSSTSWCPPQPDMSTGSHPTDITLRMPCRCVRKPHGCVLADRVQLSVHLDPYCTYRSELLFPVVPHRCPILGNEGTAAAWHTGSVPAAMLQHLKPWI
jgi:hypothetical protein